MVRCPQIRNFSQYERREVMLKHKCQETHKTSLEDIFNINKRTNSIKFYRQDNGDINTYHNNTKQSLNTCA